MKKIILCAVLACSLLNSRAQTVDEIIGQYENALGGREKLLTIQSLHLSGISTGQNGNEITTDIWKMNGKLYRRTINFGMGTSTTLITDKGAWQTNFRNAGAFEPMPEQQKNSQVYEMDCTSPLVNYAAKGHHAELLGKDTLAGKENYKIKVTTKEGRELIYDIDATTYLISRLSYKGRGRPGGGGGPGANNSAAAQEIDINVDFSNYDKTPEGFLFPFSQTITGGFSGTMTFEKVEINPAVDEKLFKPE